MKKITICWCCLSNVNNVCLPLHSSFCWTFTLYPIKWWEICTNSNDLIIIVHATISCLLLFIYFCNMNTRTEPNRIDLSRIESIWFELRYGTHIHNMYWFNDGGNHVVNFMQITQYHTIKLIWFIKINTQREKEGVKEVEKRQTWANGTKIQRRRRKKANELKFQVTSFNFIRNTQSFDWIDHFFL